MVTESLSLRPETVNIYLSPNRPNIYLYKEHVTKNLKTTFKWLIDLVKENGRETPKTIIYCKSQKACGQLFRHFKCELGELAYIPFEEHISINMYLGMYHHNTLKKHQERVLNSLMDPAGVCRVVFASTALGMGVNIKDVRTVIHYGPPREVEDLIQEIGRGGRDMLPSKAILLYTGNHLRKCDKTVTEYATNNDRCLRKLLLQDFDPISSDYDNANTHTCCVVCHKKCRCGTDKCVEPLIDICSHSEKTAAPKRKKRKVTKESKELLAELLEDHQRYLSSECDLYFLPSESCTGFTNLLIKSVIKQCKYIFTLEDINELVPVYKKEHATDILYMLNDVFQDIEVDYTALEVETSENNVYFDHDLEYGGQFESSGDSQDNDSDDSQDSIMSGITEL